MTNRAPEGDEPLFRLPLGVVMFCLLALSAVFFAVTAVSPAASPAFALFTLGAGAAENCLVKGKSADGKPYHTALSPAWTDEEMLKALGLDIRKSKMSKSSGPDGEARVYLSGMKRINIVRSASTGIYVMPHIKDDDTYVEWELQPCRADISLHKKVHG